MKPPKLLLLAAAGSLLFSAANAMAANASISGGFNNVKIQIIDLMPDAVESSYTVSGMGAWMHFHTLFDNVNSYLDESVSAYGTKELVLEHNGLLAQAVSADALAEGGTLTFDVQDNGALRTGEALDLQQSAALSLTVAANTMLVVTGQYTYRETIDPVLGYTARTVVSASFDPTLATNAWRTEQSDTFTRNFTIGYINNTARPRSTYLSFDSHVYIDGPGVAAVSAVPEPAEGAMLALGVGLVACAARRRRRRNGNA